MLNLSELIIDPRSVGKKLFLVGIKPVYEYKDGHRVSDEVVGFKYDIAMPEHQMEKLSVRIDGKCLMTEPESFEPVVLDGLRLSLYWTPSGHQIRATATGIKSVSGK